MATHAHEERKPRSILVPKFDRRSAPAYITLMLMLCFGGALTLTRGFTLSAAVFKLLPLVCLWIVSAGLLRRMGWRKTSTWLEANALAYGHAIPSFMIISPAASFALPVVDAYLAGADKALGFDWVGTIYWLQPYLRPLKFAYFSFGWQPTIIIAILAAMNPTRCWQYVTAGIGCGLITGIVFIFTPAYGGFVYYGIKPEDYEPFTYLSPPWNWLPAFEKLRNGYKVIDLSVMAALVSFPSYHAAMAVLSTWATWVSRWLRFPVLILNCGLLAGALVWGTHYFIDLIAGGLLAVAWIAVARRFITESPAQIPSSRSLEPSYS